MKIFSPHVHYDFISCLGYKGYIIKEYFANYFLQKPNVAIDLVQNNLTVRDSQAELW